MECIAKIYIFILIIIILQVNLKDYIMNLKNELNTIVSEMEYNFSQDQKYLLCLARAIITQNKILIFDDVFDIVDKR